MTQEEFNQMLQVAIAGGLSGYATSKYSLEEIEERLDGAGGGGVTSFNGRTGAVIPQAVDYTPEMIGAVSSENFFKKSNFSYSSEKINSDRSAMYGWVLGGKIIIISIYFETALGINNNDQIATIPSGYRPSGYMNFTLINAKDSKTISAFIEQNGLFIISGGASQSTGSFIGYSIYPLA